MPTLRTQTRQAAKLTTALGQLASEHPEAFDGVGAQLPGARDENQPFNRRGVKSSFGQFEKNEARVQKRANALDDAKSTRDEKLLADLPHLRATIKRIRVFYPNKDHPVRKRLEGLMGE